MEHLAEALAWRSTQSVAPSRPALLDQPGHWQGMAHEAVRPLHSVLASRQSTEVPHVHSLVALAIELQERLELVGPHPPRVGMPMGTSVHHAIDPARLVLHL